MSSSKRRTYVTPQNNQNLNLLGTRLLKADGSQLEIQTKHEPFSEHPFDGRISYMLSRCSMILVVDRSLRHEHGAQE